jgi:hypothetical protein
MSVNKKYKDTVFRMLFNNPKMALELYNAIFGADCKDWSAVKINTLANILFMGLGNDISFEIYDLLVLIEHQSTINENMARRMLMYLGRLYEKETNKDPDAIYKQNLEEIPNSEFIVLYNGKENFPKESTLNLSTAFKNKSRKFLVDLKVRVININKGVNLKIESRSKTLADYISFIAKVREYEEKHPIEEAIKSAIIYCIDNDILKDFLQENATEVISVLTTEFDIDRAVKVAHKEGIQKGSEKGQDYVLELMEQGLSYEEIKKKIEESKKTMHNA